MADGIAVALPLGINDTDGAYILHKDLTSMAEQNLKMVILTNPGERIMKPDFGAGIRQFLFEPATSGTATLVRQRIQDQVNKYLPYIDLLSLNVYTSEVGEATLVVSLQYAIPAANIVSDVTIDVATAGATGAGAGMGGGGY